MTPKKIIFLILVILGFLSGLYFNTPLDKHNKNQQNKKNTEINVLVTIKPLYSLVSGLTKNVPGVKTQLLLSPPNSPHTFHLKPSDVTNIVQSDLLIWVGPELENFLINPVENLKPTTQTLNLIQAANLNLLPIRQDDHWEAHDHGDHGDHASHNHDHEHHDHEHHDHHHGSIDPHIWLNTKNAKQIIVAISKKLQAIDPSHSALYLKNTHHMIEKLDTLHTKITNDLKTVNHKPFLVFHDAYQYFEKEFGLQANGSITINPHIPLSAQRLNHLQGIIQKDNIQCVFSEPEFSRTIVEKLLQQTKTKNFELDPLGARIQTNPNQEEMIYFDLMQELSDSFKACLLSN